MKDLIWETRKIKVKDLIQLEINPRKITEEKRKALTESLNKFNLVEIPAVNTDLKIIGGNQRVMALMLSGREEEEIDVRYPNRKLTDKEVKEYAIISNTHAGEFDFDLLESDFAEIDLSDIGFELDGLDEWLQEKEKKAAKQAKEDDYEVPEGGIETDIVLGDLFEIGPHRLLCGDSTIVESFQKLLGQELVDMVVTDPPYNVDYQGGDRTEMKALHRRTDGLKIQNDKMDDKSFYLFLYNHFASLGSFTKKGGVWYVWHADMETVNFRTSFKDAGLTPKQNLVWVKDIMVMGRQDYHWQHEPCLYGWKEGAAHHWNSDRKQTTILKFERPRISKEHPTMKPVKLFAYQISNSSKVGDIVADGFGGSGTTMVACHQLNRKARLVELDPKYCQAIIDRMLKLDPDIEIKRNGQKYERNI